VEPRVAAHRSADQAGGVVTSRKSGGRVIAVAKTVETGRLLNAYVGLLEYHLPKHSRIEAAIDDGNITVELRQFQRSVQWADGTPLYPHPLNRDRSGDG